MFKRSIKYLVLILTGVAFYYFYLLNKEPTEVVFDEEYVINLFDSNKKLESETQALGSENLQLQQSLAEYRKKLAQTIAFADAGGDKLLRCEKQAQAYKDLSDRQSAALEKNQSQQQNNVQKCNDQSLQLNFLRTQTQTLQQQLDETGQQSVAQSTQVAELTQRLESINQEASKVAGQKEALLAIIETLKQDITSPVYLKKIYVTPVYCNETQNEEALCLEKVLVMPKFSKTPFTQVKMTLVAPNGNTLADYSFDASKVRVVNFSLQRRKAYPRGDYKVVLEVDKQVLTSEDHLFTGSKDNQQ